MYPHVETATGVDCEMAGVGHKYGDGRRGELAGRVGWVWWWWLRREMNWREREESRGGASVPGCVLDSKDQPQCKQPRAGHTPLTLETRSKTQLAENTKNPPHTQTARRDPGPVGLPPRCTGGSPGQATHSRSQAHSGGHARLPVPTLSSPLPCRCTYPHRSPAPNPPSHHAHAPHPADFAFPALNVIPPPPHLKARTITAAHAQTYLHPGAPQPPRPPHPRCPPAACHPSRHQMGSTTQCAETLVPAAFTLHRTAPPSVDEVSPRSPAPPLTCSSSSRSPLCPLSPQRHRRLRPSPDHTRSPAWDQSDISSAAGKKRKLVSTDSQGVRRH